MSITTELRDFVDGLACHKVTRDLLREIADRIDELVGREYIELPKDADGETIRIGDKLGGYNKTIEVMELRYGRSGWVLVSRDGNAYHDTAAFVHVKPDSWERIISDATAFGAQMKRRTYQIGDFVERCKRLAGEDA